MIHGGIAREARRAAIAAFNSDPVVRVMIANDAAGEGVNLQRGAHLMVNYDLPWNPNRLEQRFGRIHRIGQTEVCHLWNLCAANTREGEVYRRLLEKLEEARAALGGKVYDVLGELFEGHALRDLLVDAIRYGDRPETKAELFRKVDGAVDVDAIEKLVAERKLTSEGMNPQLGRRNPRADGAGRRRAAFSRISSARSSARPSRCSAGASPNARRAASKSLRVPSILKERDRLIGRSDPVLDRYARITFEKILIVGQPQAELVAPGHPLLEALVDVVLERFQPLLAQGGVLVDEADEGVEPRLLVYLEHAIRDGRTGRSGEPRAISQRLQFIFLKEDGSADGWRAGALSRLPPDHGRGARAGRGRDRRALAVGRCRERRRSATPIAISGAAASRRGEDAPDRRDRQGRARGARPAHARDQLLGRARRAAARRGARRQGAAHQRPERGGDGRAPRRAAAPAPGGARPRAPDFGGAAGAERRRPGDPGRAPQGAAASRADADRSRTAFAEDPIARARSSGSRWRRSWRPNARSATSRATCRPRRRARTSKAAIRAPVICASSR